MNAKKFISELSEEEISPTVSKLIDFIQQQSEELQGLRDEIARLKGQKPKPKIKPSNLDKKTKQSIEKRKANPKQKKKPRPLSYMKNKSCTLPIYLKARHLLIIKITSFRI